MHNAAPDTGIIPIPALLEFESVPVFLQTLHIYYEDLNKVYLSR